MKYLILSILLIGLIILVVASGQVTNPPLGGGGSGAFSTLTGGTNSDAAMFVGTGASLGVSGSGTITATTATSATTAANLSGTPTLPSGTIILTPPNTQTSSYVLALTDVYVRMNLTSTANTVTVPLNSSQAFPVGTSITVRQTGTGVTTIVAAGGVTITTPSSLVLRTQFSSVQLVKVATDSWDLMGDTQ